VFVEHVNIRLAAGYLDLREEAVRRVIGGRASERGVGPTSVQRGSTSTTHALVALTSGAARFVVEAKSIEVSGNASSTCCHGDI
jgi:hypothetical protein